MSIVKIVNLLGLQEIKVRVRRINYLFNSSAKVPFRLTLCFIIFQWHIQECSAINGIGIKAGLCWLHNELKKTWNPKIEKFI